jgi:AGCS family alanine or glycine:cation symporter
MTDAIWSVRAIRWQWLGVFCVGLLTIVQPASAQPPAESSPTVISTSTAPRVILENPPPLTAFEQIDAVFKQAVALLEKVMFYRIGATERSYILYEPQSVYFRLEGTDGDFQKLNSGDDSPQQLSQSQVDLLAASGQVVSPKSSRQVASPLRSGVLDRQAVEYVVIKRGEESAESIHYGDKFVEEAGGKIFRKTSPKRELMTEITVPAETVARWWSEGALVPADKPSSTRPPYLHTESIGGIPVIVAWLAAGAVFFTISLRLFNIWGFAHAVEIVRGKYDNPTELGEVTHFQALSSALSGTVGLGNIAGVTIAMTMGGPGAFFWMLLCGLLGMSSKFVECTLAVKFREIKPDGTVLGGPMKYLHDGLRELGLGTFGFVLSIVFSVMCIFGSFGGGNMLQANQSGSAILQMFQDSDLKALHQLDSEIEGAAHRADVPRVQELQKQYRSLQDRIGRFEYRFKLIYGLVLAAMVGIVILGGIRRIAAAAEKIVPAMCLLYIAACLYIISQHLQNVPEVLGQVFSEAFTGAAMGGGLVGVLVVGVRRAAFSNEAGAGSAPIAHSAARTNEPIREGCVALLEPFIDTVVVCSMTALVILVTGAWDHEEWVVRQGLQGSALTSRVFQEEGSWLPVVLSVAVGLFAYSTIISWSYYGERSWAYLFGVRSTILYKVLAVCAVFIGTVVNLGSVLDFSDMMILGMAFPNILGLLLLLPGVRRDLARYWQRYRAGEFAVSPPE